MISPENLRYPIGQFKWPEHVTSQKIDLSIGRLGSFPARFRQAVEPLTEEQLNTLYRKDGWTLRQVVHHVPDSH